MADRWTGHQLLVLPNAAARRVAVARWVQEGLDGGEKLLYAGHRDAPTTERLVASVTGLGVDAARAGQDGRLVVVDPTRFYSVEGYRDLVERAFAEGRSGVRTFGGPHAAAAVVDADRFAELERTFEQMWGAAGVSALCCYDGDAVAGHGGLDVVIGRHSSGWGDAGLRAGMPGPGRLRIEGEVDAGNDEVLAAVVAAALERVDAARVEAVLVVDCAGLEFMSVSAWRVMVRATAPFRRAGGRVQLHGLPELAATVLRVIGFEGEFELTGEP